VAKCIAFITSKLGNIRLFGKVKYLFKTIRFQYCGASHLQCRIAYGEMDMGLVAFCFNYNTKSPTAKIPFSPRLLVPIPGVWLCERLPYNKFPGRCFPVHFKPDQVSAAGDAFQRYSLRSWFQGLFFDHFPINSH
jgi:hypothetical protein